MAVLFIYSLLLFINLKPSSFFYFLFESSLKIARLGKKEACFGKIITGAQGISERLGLETFDYSCIVIIMKKHNIFLFFLCKGHDCSWKT